MKNNYGNYGIVTNYDYFRHAKDLFRIITGSLVVAIAINMFIANHHLTFGGVPGIAVIANELLSIHIAITYWVLNIPLFLLSRKTNGLPFMVKSIVSASLVSLFLFMTEPLQYVSCDDILGAIFGGVLLGVGVGIVFSGNGSIGGTTLAACMLHAQFKIPREISMFMIGGMVIVSGAAIFGLNKTL
jgi:uncharacterized membrane-anchored protein YitT (DUF2179 family)